MIINIDTKLNKTDKQIIITEINNEIMAMDLESGDYIHFNEIGKEIWNLLDDKHTISDICNSLLLKFEVDKDTCINQTTNFINELIKHQLISHNE